MFGTGAGVGRFDRHIGLMIGPRAMVLSVFGIVFGVQSLGGYRREWSFRWTGYGLGTWRDEETCSAKKRYYAFLALILL